MVGGIDKSANGSINDDGDRLGVCGVGLAACDVDDGRGGSGCQIDSVGRDRRVKCVGEIDVFAARVNGNRNRFITGSEWPVDEKVKNTAGLNRVSD